MFNLFYFIIFIFYFFYGNEGVVCDRFVALF